MEVKRRFVCDSEFNLEQKNPDLIRIAEIRYFHDTPETPDYEGSYRLVTYFPKSQAGKITLSHRTGLKAQEQLYEDLQNYAKENNYQIIEQP